MVEYPKRALYPKEVAEYGPQLLLGTLCHDVNCCTFEGEHEVSSRMFCALPEEFWTEARILRASYVSWRDQKMALSRIVANMSQMSAEKPRIMLKMRSRITSKISKVLLQSI